MSAPTGGKARLVHEECIRALGGVKCAAKRQVAGFNIKLTVMLIPVYLWLSAVAAVKNCQNLGLLTSCTQCVSCPMPRFCQHRSDAQLRDNFDKAMKVFSIAFQQCCLFDIQYLPISFWQMCCTGVFPRSFEHFRSAAGGNLSKA